MTVKGKRADSLRKMTHDEADAYQMGGMVDESLPTEALRELLKPYADQVDVSAFENYLAPAVGRYRDMARSSDDQPSVAEELDLLDEAFEAIEQARMRLTNLPPMADAYAHEVCWKGRAEAYADFSQRLDADLIRARAVLVGTEHKLDPHKGKTGRKSMSLRDCLLRDTAHWLQRAGIGPQKAAGVAAAVLNAAGIRAPGNSRDARKIVIRLERG